MVPHTSDGRVMFAIPWHEHTLVGTTDTPISEVSLEPVAMEEEIEFILTTAAQYLHKAPSRSDVLSVFAGIRPLVKSGAGRNTAGLSRDHTIHIDGSGLLSIAGGKWTTYRHMAEDCVNQASMLAKLPEKPCGTENLNIHGFHKHPEKFGPLAVYGSDAMSIQDLIRADPTSRRAAASGASVLRRRVRFRGSVRDGADVGRCAFAPHAGAAAECAGGHSDGSAGCGVDGPRIGP